MSLTRSSMIALALLFSASTTQAAPAIAPAGLQSSVIELAATKPKAAAKKAAPKKKVAKKTAKSCKGEFMYNKGGKCMDARAKPSAG